MWPFPAKSQRAKNYQDLLERAVRPEEIRRLKYCASALFDAYEDLSELYQDGESRYKSVKGKLDEVGEHKRTTQAESKTVVRNTDVTLAVKGETDKAWQTIDEALDEMVRLHQTGPMSTEEVVRLSEKVQNKCEQLQEIYKRMKTTLRELQSRYEEVQAFAQKAYKSPYRNQVEQQLQSVSELDSEKQIPQFLERYRATGRGPGNSGVQGYKSKLDNLVQTFEDFLAQQDRLRKLNELQQGVEQLIEQVEKHIQSLDSMEVPVEAVERLDNVPLFFRSELETMHKDAQRLLSTVENPLGKLTVTTTETEPLIADLTNLQAELRVCVERQDTFKEDVRLLNYSLKAILSPMTFPCLEATYEKFLGDFRFQLQKRVQETYRTETYETAHERYKDTHEYVEQAKRCLREIGDLDNWFEELRRDFDTSKFGGASTQDNAGRLAGRIEDLKQELLQRFPKEIGKASELLRKNQDKRAAVDETLGKLRSLAEKECEDRIDEARRVVEQFEDSLSPIRTQIRRMLGQAVVQRKQGSFAESLSTTNQAVSKMEGHLEQAQGSRSARLQVTLLSQPGLGFLGFVKAYEERFGVEFDEETGAELIRLLKEGKLRGTFSI